MMFGKEKDGEIGGLELIPSLEYTKSNINSWTTIDKNDWNLPQKIFYIYILPLAWISWVCNEDKKEVICFFI